MSFEQEFDAAFAKVREERCDVVVEGVEDAEDVGEVGDRSGEWSLLSITYVGEYGDGDDDVAVGEEDSGIEKRDGVSREAIVWWCLY
jgi:hypothetical protein